ncbi:hypothetical protein TanjilG_08986 [Lupinus angustifolius]|uniref:PUM-HD domain-containing protein n=1 Tax=Lupinus angustifolius TaxID=3871 RepID=A0A4P1QPA1_LUPAN|nr:hypothetical protein TanjilG_08986 [Lupinus angustifolius]
MRDNVNDVWEVDELQRLLDEEIPLATSHINNNHNLLHHHDDDDHVYGNGNGIMYYDDPFKYPCVSSPVSGFSLDSVGGSSSSLFSAMHSSSDTGSPNDGFVDELGLAANLSKMYIANQKPNPNMYQFSFNGNDPMSVRTKHGDYNNFKRDYVGDRGFRHEPEMKSALLGLGHDYKMANLFRSQTFPGRQENTFSQLNSFRDSMHPPRHVRQLINDDHCRGSLKTEIAASLSRNRMVDASLYAQKYGMNLMEERGMPRSSDYSFCRNLRPYMSDQDSLHHGFPPCNERTVPPLNARIAQGNLDTITSEGSFILQGEILDYGVSKRGSDRSRCRNAVSETGIDILQRVVGACENPMSPRIGYPLPLLTEVRGHNVNSLSEVRGHIYLIAKDQYGCRFLQRMFDEGTPDDVQVIFNEIIHHVVELMINPFGNYLMQKLLDVCNEEQRMQIILMVTRETGLMVTRELGQLVRISLNPHGTRVVQKLIETLKTKQQISVVVSALERGFLVLIKDLNGNHVFIFVAAAKYCVDIATHQHGCCVLQRCIGHSNGEHREKLVAEICSNALLLAQDPFGNYVVQFILELRSPSATENIISQFEGNYLHLSMQKFGSHVVEKCLAVFNDENRSRVIFELVSAHRFGQLLQDPHANYVVQSALRHSKGHVHSSLVEAIESHKTISRNSPYSKKIFSQKLLKK